VAMGENDSPPQQEPAAPMEFMPLLLRAAITNFASSCPLSYRCKKTVT